MVHRLDREQLIPRPVEEVFPFFADAANLETLTPAFLRFRILGPSPAPIAKGALIDYRLRIRGLPVRWRTRIEAWEEGVRFVDVQLTGPYRSWRHLHEFSPAPGGTLMRDVVDYELPLGWLGEIAHALFVRRDVEQIFDFRRRKIEELFPARVDGRST